jgi:hypothetical protein
VRTDAPRAGRLEEWDGDDQVVPFHPPASPPRFERSLEPRADNPPLTPEDEDEDEDDDG